VDPEVVRARARAYKRFYGESITAG